MYKGLKCSSMFVCFIDFFRSLEFTRSQNAEKFNCTGSVSFCDSVYDNNFLKHCAASLVSTSF